MTLFGEPKNSAPSLISAPNSRSLVGVRVLIIEDDYYLAMETKGILEEAGAEVVGPVSSFEHYQQAYNSIDLNCAIIDINLGKGPSFTAAEQLNAQGTPFLFLTGYASEAISENFRSVIQLQKPAKTEALIKAVNKLLNQ